MFPFVTPLARCETTCLFADNSLSFYIFDGWAGVPDAGKAGFELRKSGVCIKKCEQAGEKDCPEGGKQDRIAASGTRRLAQRAVLKKGQKKYE